MKIDVHAICWNEARLLPLFLQHYASFASRIFVWDNFSDDGSRQLIEACPNAVLMSYDSGGEYSERILQRLKNNCWKWSTADWVIVCDVDELVYHPHLLQYLEEQSDADVLKCVGFNLVGPESMSLQPLAQWKASFSDAYCKSVVFRPEIREIGFSIGSHRARATSPVRRSDLRLFHMHYSGSVESLQKRHAAIGQRQSSHDVQAGLGNQFRLTDDQLQTRYRNLHRSSLELPVVERVREVMSRNSSLRPILKFLEKEGITPPARHASWTSETLERCFGHQRNAPPCTAGIWKFEDPDKYHFDGPLAEALSDLLVGKSVIDFGCGAGRYVEILNELSQCRGYDGNPNTRKLTDNQCEVLDIARPVTVEPADWVLCLEVAEHIPLEHEDTLINNLHQHNRIGIVVSWAQKGQGGCGHVNERDPDYVADLFIRLGYRLCRETGEKLREASTLRWFRRNIMVFLRS